MIPVSYKKRDLYNIIAYLCKKISVFFCKFPMILCVTFFCTQKTTESLSLFNSDANKRPSEGMGC